MSEILPIDYLRGAVAGIEDKLHAPISPAIGAQGSDVSREQVALRGDIIAGFQGREGVRITLAQGVNDPGDRGQIVRIGLAIVDQLLRRPRVTRESTRL